MVHELSRFRNVFLLLLLAICFFIYWLGLPGEFVFDDIPNIVMNAELRAVQGFNVDAILAASFSSESGVLKRPISMLSFALNHAAAGMNPYAFKLTNILIHLINGFLVFLLTSLWLKAPTFQPLFSQTHYRSKFFEWVPFVAAAVWLLNPLQLTSVLYAVQRMTSLSTAFVFLGIILYCLGRTQQLQGRGKGVCYILASYFLCLPLAVLSKENGILLLPLIFWVELCLYQGKGLSKKAAHVLWSVHTLTVLLPMAMVLISLLVAPNLLLGGYEGRNFDLSTRLLTQARMLWVYCAWFFFPSLKQLALFHDDITLSLSLFSPITTIISVLSLVVVVFFVFVKQKGGVIWNVFRFSVGFYLVAHSLESSIIPLEMVHEHRNYLPTVGLAFLFSCLLAIIFTGKIGARARKIGILLIVAYLVMIGTVTMQRSLIWKNEHQRALMEAQYHEGSPRAQTTYAQILYSRALQEPEKENRDALLMQARHHLEMAAKADEYTILPEANLIIVDSAMGRLIDRERIFFISEFVANPPLASETIESVHSIFKCQLDGRCGLQRSALLTLIEALESNPQTPALQKVRIYALMVNILLRDDDLEAALEYAQKAIDVLPNNMQAHLNFAAVLYKAGRADEARAHLQSLSGINMNEAERAAYNEMMGVLR